MGSEMCIRDRFLPDAKPSSKKDALDFLKAKKDEISDLNLRSLIQVVNIADSGDKDWKDLAKYVIGNGQ